MTPSAPRAPRRTAAFFDFDDTVIATSAGRLFGRELVRIRWRRALDTRPGTVAWAARVLVEIAYLAYAGGLYASMAALNRLRVVKRSTVVRTAYRHMRGWSHDEILDLSRDYFDELVAGLIYPEAVAAMEAHRADGRLVVVATTNMRELVDNVKRFAPVDHVIGCEIEAKDGRLTGRIHGPTWGEEKAAAVREWAHASDVSLPKSHAYSDHFSDHAFLGLVGHPHVVNGDRRLRRMARRKGWDIHWYALPAEPRG